MKNFFKNIDAFIFDLDGVLIDSAPDISLAVNATLAHFSFNTLPIPQITTYIGNGIRTLLKRSINASCGRDPEFNIKIYSDNWHDISSNTTDEQYLSNEDESFFVGTKNKENFQQIVDFYREYYKTNSVIKTSIYKGMTELLNKIHKKNIPMAIASNKPRLISNVIFDKLDLTHFFDVVAGPEDVENIKPASDMLFFVQKQLSKKFNKSFTATNMVMIGDSASDIMAAKNFGCKSVAITSGYGNIEKLNASGADMFLSLAGEIIQFL
ncbi:MAG: HAD hydrolase-like protein [Treponema sp.]|nr:HAD hydrolase-like protein [Treponema sp.]